MNSRIAVWCLAVFLIQSIANGDEATPPSNTSKVDPLTAEAQAAVDQLRQQLPADSEAIAMLDDILSGRRLGADDGWFPLAKAQTRFDWDFVLKTHDADSDKMVTATEFPGSKEDFARLDRDGDDKLTEVDFDWSQHSLTPTPGYMMFLMADRNANGKVTKDEFVTLFETLASGEEEYLALDDVRERFVASSKPSSEERPDRPSRSTLVVGLKNQEVGSLQPGPTVNEPAPDFTLRTITGESVALSEEIGEKPIVLIFGNFTCGPFRSQAGNIEKLHYRYNDRAKMFLVYVREAHPADGWWMMSNQQAGIDLPQPQDNAARLMAATTCQQHLDLRLPFLIDDIDDRVGTTYSGMPNRLYLIDKEGRIAFKSGRGPFGFHPRQLEQALILLLN